MSFDFHVTARILSLRNMRVKTKICNCQARGINRQYSLYFGVRYKKRIRQEQTRTGNVINPFGRIFTFMGSIAARLSLTHVAAPVDHAGSHAA
jgi:hypothetical protein